MHSQMWLKFVFNSDSLHARLNSHYEAWSYKKKKHKKITVKRCLLNLDLKPLRYRLKESILKAENSRI